MSFFAKYQTYRRVNVEGGIGLVYYSLLGVMVVIIALYMCGYAKAHLFLEDKLEGTTWARLQQPRGKSMQCSADLGDAKCEVWDWLEAFKSEPRSSFIATFVQEKLQRRACPRLRPHCDQKLWEDVADLEFYPASPEDFELILEHRVIDDIQGTLFQIGNSDTEGILLPADYPELSFTPTGLLYNASGAMRTFSSGARDVLKVSEVLAAAGVVLTDPVCLDCGDKEIQGLGRSLRRWGLHLDVTLVYSNLWYNLSPWFGCGPARYAYLVRHFPIPEGVRVIETLPASPYFSAGPEGAEVRVVRRTYGIQLHYHQAGLIGVPSSASVLTFIVGALTLLSVPWTVSELYVSLVPFLRRPKWYAAVVTNEADVAKEKAQ